MSTELFKPPRVDLDKIFDEPKRESTGNILVKLISIHEPEGYEYVVWEGRWHMIPRIGDYVKVVIDNHLKIYHVRKASHIVDSNIVHIVADRCGVLEDEEDTKHWREDV